MVKIGLPWLLLVVMKLTNRETKSEEILSFRDVYDICRAEPSADVCDWLDRGPPPPPQQQGIGLPLDGGSPDKRRQKAVFSSWGGKRQSGTKRPFYSWSGKRASYSRPKQTFTTWGGRKRAAADEPTADAVVGYEERTSAEKTTDVGDKPRDDKKNRGGDREAMTNGVRALFAIFSDWSKDPEAKKGVRYAGLKSIRRSVDFFPWGGKRSGVAADRAE